MKLVDSLEAGTGVTGAVSDVDGLIGEVLAVGVILTVYLFGVATDRHGRKV